MNVLSLFTGIGGLDLAAEWAGMQTIAFCERDKFCQKVLAKHWPKVPCFDDVTTLKANDIHAPVDLIAAGYPCQPFSVAGRRKGKDDERYLYPECSRLIDEFWPAWFVGENVAGHITSGLDAVCDDLESKGYAVQAYVFPSCAVGSWHKRERVFVIANSQRVRPQGGVGHAVQREQGKPRKFQGGDTGFADVWSIPKPWVCRASDGIPNRMDRLKSLGNAVVPQQAYPIFKAIMDIQAMAA